MSSHTPLLATSSLTGSSLESLLASSSSTGTSPDDSLHLSPFKSVDDLESHTKNAYHSLTSTSHRNVTRRVFRITSRAILGLVALAFIRLALSPAVYMRWLFDERSSEAEARRMLANWSGSGSVGKPDSTLTKVHLVIPITRQSLGRRSCMSLASALIHGYEPRILGWEVVARPGQTTGQFYNFKLAGLHEYLMDIGSTLPSDDLVLLVDGHDTLLQLPAEHVLERYYKINKDRERGDERIVTGADKACFPHIWSECNSAPISPLPARTYGDENGIWRDPSHRPRYSNTGMIIGPVSTLNATLNEWKKTKDWLKWVNDQSPFNRALQKNETTVDYYGQIVWTGGADLASFNAVAVTEPIDGIHSVIPYGPLLPKLGMSTATGQIPAVLHYNMDIPAGVEDALSKDEAFDMISKQLWWSSGREVEFREIALRELHSRRIFTGAGDRAGRDYDEICGAYKLYGM